MTDQTFSTDASDRIKVWDIGVRLFHWGLVSGVVTAYFTVETRSLHRTIGYIVIGLIAFRLIWGVIGSRHARFKDFVPTPAGLIAYLRAMISGSEDRHLGHNPAGGAMIVAFLATLAGICATGYMMGTKAYFGVSWVEHLHGNLVTLLLVLIAGHLTGVIVASLRHRENLAKSMVTGWKEKDAPHP